MTICKKNYKIITLKNYMFFYTAAVSPESTETPPERVPRMTFLKYLGFSRKPTSGFVWPESLMKSMMVDLYVRHNSLITEERGRGAGFVVGKENLEEYPPQFYSSYFLVKPRYFLFLFINVLIKGVNLYTGAGCQIGAWQR